MALALQVVAVIRMHAKEATWSMCDFIRGFVDLLYVKQQARMDPGINSSPETHRHTQTLVLSLAGVSFPHDSSLLTHRSSAQHGNE